MMTFFTLPSFNLHLTRHQPGVPTGVAGAHEVLKQRLPMRLGFTGGTRISFNPACPMT